MQVLERINDNAYKLDFPNEYNVSAIFNITEWNLFYVSDDLRTNHLQDEGNNGGTAKEWVADPLEIPLGPMTRARAKRFKEALNVLIQEAQVEGAHLLNSKEGTKMVHVIKVTSELDKELRHFWA